MVRRSMIMKHLFAAIFISNYYVCFIEVVKLLLNHLIVPYGS